ncbi:MAG TPA: VWA domain-containing protein, partial [Polyangiaceae bacterium]|nr:VWA domain-containing protein [Polyangiaceae bacterium]
MKLSHLLALATFLVAALGSSPAVAADCTPPRILLVVDTSTSMLGQIPDGAATTTKWAAAQTAVKEVFKAFPDAAQYGLMVFPGKAGQCSTGEVLVDPASGTAASIEQTLQNLVIPANNQTPAGQTLMAASQYAKITDPGYANYVIFVTDGYQYCSVNSGAACASAADCTLMGVGTCPTCLPSQPDGCFCVQNWSALGADALSKAGVKTFVVGFGDNVNFQALNQTAQAGGTALTGCNPNATVASCYFQAQNPTDLKSALGTIVTQVVTSQCTGDCGISGTQTCTVTGWSPCDAPTTIACTSTCNTPGTQDCVSGALSQCSSESACNSGGAGGTSG